MKRHYIRVSGFALATIIDALEKDEKVKDITVSLEDGELLVAFDFDRYAAEKNVPCNIHGPIIYEPKQKGRMNYDKL